VRTVRIPEAHHKKLKMIAIVEGVTLQTLVESIIRDYIENKQVIIEGSVNNEKK